MVSRAAITGPNWPGSLDPVSQRRGASSPGHHLEGESGLWVARAEFCQAEKRLEDARLAVSSVCPPSLSARGPIFGSARLGPGAAYEASPAPAKPWHVMREFPAHQRRAVSRNLPGARANASSFHSLLVFL